MKPHEIIRAMRDCVRDGVTHPDWASWPEYHRLRRLLADLHGVSLGEAERLMERALPNGHLPE